MQVGWIGLITRVDLHDHAILVALGVQRRNLPLRKRIVQRIVDVLNLDAEPRRRVAVDLDVGLQAALFAVGGDVDDAGQPADAFLHARHPFLQFLEVRAPQGELIL